MLQIKEGPVTEPGFYRLTAAEYHAGPCPQPELSNSIAQVILNESPLHAFTMHPKLGNAPVETDESEEDDDAPARKSSLVMEMGSAIHKIVLGYGADIVVADPAKHLGKRGGVPKGWTNDSIRAVRDEAIASGKIPVLKSAHDQAVPAAASLQRLAEAYLGCPVADCLREIVVVTEEDGCWRKAMLDIVRPDLLRWADLKTTRVSLRPESLARFIYANDLHFQLEFYGRMLDSLDPLNAGRRRAALLFGETKAPFATGRPMEMTEAGKHVARSAVTQACALWDSCIKSGEWPGFGDEPYAAEPPVYLMNAITTEGFL